MLPVSICRHLDVEWLESTSCYCNDCGKLGRWFDGLVLWQRRPRRAAQAEPALLPVSHARDAAELSSHGG